MTQLFGISGTHGTGKSTVLQTLKAKGFSVVATTLSRNCQATLGWDTLDRAKESFSNAFDLQLAILNGLAARDKEVHSQPLGGSTFVERTPLDLWAYMAMWCKVHNVSTSRLEVAMYKEALKMRMFGYNKIFILHPTDKIAFVADPHRANLEDRLFVENEIANFASEHGLGNHFIDIYSTSADERVADICASIGNIEETGPATTDLNDFLREIDLDADDADKAVEEIRSTLPLEKHE